MKLSTVQLELGEHWSLYQQALQDALAHSNKLLAKLNGYIIDTAGKQMRWLIFQYRLIGVYMGTQLLM
jgi:hypothetical protein